MLSMLLAIFFYGSDLARADGACQDEASELVSNISFAAEGRYAMITPDSADFKRLQELKQKDCFNFEGLLRDKNGVSITNLYFDPVTMAPIGKALVLAGKYETEERDQCRNRATTLAKKLVNAADDYGANTVTSHDFDELNQLNTQHCFDFDKLLGEGKLLSSYFDKEMKPIGAMAALRKRVDAFETVEEKFFARVVSPKEAREFAIKNKRFENIAQHLPSVSEEEKASSCQSLDGKIVAQEPPIRDQGLSGNCSYNGYADAISVAMKVNISPAYLAAVISPKGDNGTDEDRINFLIKNLGLCLQSTMPSNNPPAVDNSHEKFLEKLESAVKASLDSKTIQGCPDSKGLSKLFPGKNLTDLLQVARHVTDTNGQIQATGMSSISYEKSGQTRVSTPPAYYSHFALNQCAKDREKLPREVKFSSYWTLGNPARSFAAISKVLSSGKPAVIGYEFNRLTGGSGGGHMSTVVDRRYINGHCQFLIRNSWGKGSCTKIVSEKDACGGGYFWVNALDLSAAVSSVAHVD